MDQATLVGPDLSAGREALAILDAAHIDQIVALFMLSPEYGDWRFVISSPSLDQTHSLKAHEKVYKLLQGRFVYSLPLLMVLPTKDPFIRSLKGIFIGKDRKFGKGIKVGGIIRLGSQTVGNRFVSDAIVIRLPGVNG